jgi:uncharacterized protein YyaL (SSP411 family)
MPNRLANEKSPYLLQHANNPVDWFPWGDEAFFRAQSEGKPIFLSVGYAACHWCHVMERESFENEATAKAMNDSFIAIKVDREERPDVDAVYMDAVQALIGHGGWPMSVFLTPEGKPFFGGTYFPPEDRPGMLGFPRVLQAVLDAYRGRREEVDETAENVLQHVTRAMTTRSRGGDALDVSILDDSFDKIVATFDKTNGGFGTAPKFPQPMLIEFLLRHSLRTEKPEAAAVIERTLAGMARGGIYDHLGGGFARYSTDAQWLVPHFEKMLYDNAQLTLAYLHAYQLTERSSYRVVVEQTLEYLLRDMRSPLGGIYSTLDADSEGEEGRFYVWNRTEIETAVGTEDAEVICRGYGINAGGNFDSGRSILSRVLDSQELADALGMSVFEAEGALDSARKRLLLAREARIWPTRDEKILAGWNGLALRALAESGATLGRKDFVVAANEIAEFVLSDLKRDDGRLLRSYKDGTSAIPAYLEDHAFLANGFLSLYESTFDRRWLDEAIALADAMLEQFWDPADRLFFDTGNDVVDPLLIRPRTVLDNAIPSGGANGTELLLRLWSLTGDDRYRSVATEALRGVHEHMNKYPGAVGYWLCALDLFLATPKEIAIVGPLDDERTQALLSTVYKRYIPNKIVVAAGPEEIWDLDDLPVMDGRSMVDGLPTAFVCEHFVCKLPVTEPDALASLLDAGNDAPTQFP